MRRAPMLLAAGALGAFGACTTELHLDGDPSETDGGGEAASPGGCTTTGPCVLATEVSQAFAIAVSDNYVYFTQKAIGGAIYRVSTQGGAAERVVTTSSPVGIAVDKAKLYWTSAGTNTTSVFDSAGRIEQSNTSPPYGIALGSDKVFWTVPAVGEVWSATLQLGSPTMVGTVKGAMRIAADGTWFYAASDQASGRLERLLHDGGSPEAIGPYTNISALAVTESHVAWGSIEGVFLGNTAAGAFMNPPTAISLITAATGIAIDEKRRALFVLTGSGALERLDMTASSPVTPVDTRTTCGEGRALAQDDAMLYVACSSAILRVPKP